MFRDFSLLTNHFSLIFIDAVFARADEEEADQQDRHLERRKPDKEFAATMPDRQEMNQGDDEGKQDSDSEK